MDFQYHSSRLVYPAATTGTIHGAGPSPVTNRSGVSRGSGYWERAWARSHFSIIYGRGYEFEIELGGASLSTGLWGRVRLILSNWVLGLLIKGTFPERFTKLGFVNPTRMAASKPVFGRLHCAATRGSSPGRRGGSLAARESALVPTRGVHPGRNGDLGLTWVNAKHIYWYKRWIFSTTRRNWFTQHRRLEPSTVLVRALSQMGLVWAGVRVIYIAG